MNKVNSIRDLPFRICGLLALLLLWEYAPRLGWIESWYIPSFSVVLRETYHLFSTGPLFTHVMVTLWRAVNGLLIAIVVALPLGFILGRWGGNLVLLFNPLMRLFSQANPFSLLPIFVLCFGIGETAKLAVVAWVCFWPILFNTVSGVQAIDSQWIKAAHSLAISAPGLINKVLFPGTAPLIFVGLRIGVQMAFFVLIAGEMLGATAGLGWLLYNSFHNGLILQMFVASFCIISLGVALNRLLLFLEKRLFFWRYEENWVGTFTRPKLYKITGEYALAVVIVAIISISFIGGWQVKKASSPEFEREKNQSCNLYND